MTKVTIDICNFCQLKCPCCHHAEKKKDAISIGATTPEIFATILNLNPEIRDIELSLNGEIFLSPHFSKLVNMAKERSICTRVENGVNLNDITDEQIEALVDAPVQFLSVSIDGATEDTYCTYRQNGNFEKVISNIKRINTAKKRKGQQLPLLQWQFIQMGHNHHQIEQARKIASDLDMSFKIKTNVRQDFSPLPDDIKKTKQKNLHLEKNPCRQLIERPRINWNGDLFGCCHNRDTIFGNVAKESLTTISQSKNYRDLVLFTKSIGILREDKQTPYFLSMSILTVALNFFRARLGHFKPMTPCAQCSHYKRVFKISKTEDYFLYTIKKISQFLATHIKFPSP